MIPRIFQLSAAGRLWNWFECKAARDLAPAIPAQFRGRSRLALLNLEDRSVPATFNVTNLLDSGVGSLRTAIEGLSLSTDAANTINITATGSIPLLTGLPDINKNVTVDGPGSASLTLTRNAGASGFSLLTVNNNEGALVTIEGMTISGASAAVSGGGGLRVAAGDVNLLNAIVTGNTSLNKGGGIYNSGAGLLSITNSTVSNNSTSTNAKSTGGGINSAGSVTITNSKITGNSATVFGGGVYLSTVGAVLTVNNSTVSGNIASGRGGGAYVLGATVEITGSTFNSNLSKSSLFGGGGIMFNGYNGVGTFNVSNSTFSGNSAAGGGGGLNIRYCDATIRNSTVTGNTSSTNFGDPGDGGGGIGLYYEALGNLNLISTVVSGNVHNAGGQHNDLSVSVFGTVSAENSYVSDSSGFTLVNNVANVFDTFANLALGPLQNNGGPTSTHAILLGSKAIDKGSNIAPALTKDQTGITNRVINGGSGLVADIGAFEFTPSANPGVSASFAAINTRNGGFATNYTFTVNYNAPSGDKISTATLGTGDIIVTGPGSYSKSATFNSFTDPLGNQTLITASYTIPANTLGTANWDILDNGTYNVTMAASQVKTVTSGNFVAAGLINTISVAVGKDYVVTTTADSGAGSLRDFVALAKTDTPTLLDRIRFDATVFATQKTINLTSVLAINSDVQIVGPASKVVLDQNTIDLNVINVSDGTASPVIAEINNVIVTNGGGPLALTGGIFVGQADVLDLRNSTVSGNTGTQGGGLYIDNIASLYLRNSTVTGNSASQEGGGIYFYFNGALIVENSTISKNTASGNNGGGGLYFAGIASPGSFRISNTTISGNTADIVGGGVSVRAGPASNNFEFFNCTITDNKAGLDALTGNGGGIARTDGPGKMTLVSTIVSGNFAGLAEPDISHLLADTIIATNSAVGDDPGAAWLADNNLPTSKNLAFGAVLQLSPLANNGGSTTTHNFTAASPLVNAGSNPFGYATDQIGGPRSQLGGVDIGAIERVATGPVVSSIVVNNGDTQRSRLTRVVVNFASGIDAAQFQTAGAIFFTRTGVASNNVEPNGTIVNNTNGLIISPATGTVTSLTLTFANIDNAGIDFGSLSDGRWQLSVVPAGFTSANGPTDIQLRRLFGDTDNSGNVDGTDFGTFPPFGATIANPFDFNNDSNIDGADFGEFGGRFGYGLA